MPISLRCKCGQKINAKDELAGKTVKCPKCGQPLQIPVQKKMEAVPITKATGGPRKWGEGATANSHLLDLLDEAGVKAKRTGPVCPECHADLDPNAVVCINCGFHLGMGRRLDMMDGTQEDDDEGLSESEKLVAKAAREIEKTPITAEGENFGDGGDSFVVALIGFVAAVILILGGIGVVTLLNSYVGESINPAKVSLYASCILLNVSHLWIIIYAFNENALQGILTLFVPCYAIFFGSQRMGSLGLPTITYVFSFVLIFILSMYLAFQEAG